MGCSAAEGRASLCGGYTVAGTPGSKTDAKHLCRPEIGRGKSRKGRIGTTRPFPYLSGKGQTEAIPVQPVGPARADKAQQSSASTAALCNYHQDAFLRDGAELGRGYSRHTDFARRTRMTKPTDSDKNVASASRRRFLREGSALLGGAVIAGGLAGSEAHAAAENTANLPPNVPEWMKTPGDPMGNQPYGSPSPFEKGVVKNIPKDLPQYLSASGRTPLQDLGGIITPNGLLYERPHAGVHTIDPPQPQLLLHSL